MTDFLVRRIARQPRSVTARIALGVGLAGLALGVRLALAPVIGLGAPFAAFILAVLVATVFGGRLSGVASVVVLSVGAAFLLGPAGGGIATRRLVGGELFFLASSGFVMWVVTLLRAALAREVAAREGERLLKLELHHRVKNTLAVVQSLAELTFRGASDMEAARHEYAARLSALAAAHDLLIDASWRDVTLDALAARVLAPFHPANDGERLVVAGEPTPISPDAAVALSLCLHELATNAAKYGALSGPQGKVRLAWRVEDANGRRRLSLDWRETGGPPPAPGRRGFGSRVLNRALSGQANAQAELTFPPEGAHWTAVFDL